MPVVPSRNSKARDRFLNITKAVYRKDPAHFSQAEAARACGVSSARLSQAFGGKAALLAEVKKACGVPLDAHDTLALGGAATPPPVPLMAEEHPQQQPQEPSKGKTVRVKRSKVGRNEDADSATTQDEQEDPFKDFPPVNASMAEHFAFASSTGLGLVFRRVLRDPSNIALGKDYTAMLSNVSKCMKEQLETTQPANLSGETVIYKDILPDNGRDENRDNVVKLGKLARKAMDNT